MLIKTHLSIKGHGLIIGADNDFHDQYWTMSECVD